MASKTISASATPERKAAWEKATGLKAPPAPEKKVTPPTPPAPVARPTTATKPSTRATPPASSATPAKPVQGRVTLKTPAEIAAAAPPADPVQQGKENANTFMQIFNGLPPEAKSRYASAFSDFLALSPEQQTGYLAGFEQTAKAIVEPAIKQKADRMKKDLTYELETKQREKKALQETYDKVVGIMDFNKNRDIAKENQTAAKVLQNIGNTAFITGVAGSGIFSRRTALAREDLQNKVDDVNIDFNQGVSQMGLKKGQGERTIDDEIARLYQLNDRDVTDLDQQKKQDELSLFLELAGNDLGKKGVQDKRILEAGVGSAEADFAAGGTDAERQARYQSLDRYLKMTPEQILAEKFKPDELSEVEKYAKLGNPTGTIFGYTTFGGQPQDSWGGNPTEYYYNEFLRPKIKTYNDILNGNFINSVKSKLAK